MLKKSKAGPAKKARPTSAATVKSKGKQQQRKEQPKLSKPITQQGSKPSQPIAKQRTKPSKAGAKVGPKTLKAVAKDETKPAKAAAQKNASLPKLTRQPAKPSPAGPALAKEHELPSAAAKRVTYAFVLLNSLTNEEATT